MASEALREFFRDKKSKSAGDIDWHARKEAWVDAVLDLYGRIQDEYLAEPVAEEFVRVTIRPKTVVEEHIGAYEISELVLLVGNEEVVLSPKGMNIVGASGRIDLVGDMGQKTIVLQPEEGWGIVEARTPTLKIVPLDEDSLLRALKEVMRR